MMRAEQKASSRTGQAAARRRRAGTARRSLPRAPVRHVTLPCHTVGQAEPLPGETIGAFVDRVGWAKRDGARWSFRLPTICVVNGAPVLQRQWKRRRIKARDVVEFWSRPWGGRNAKSIIGIVGLVALAAFAPWAGAALFGAGTFLAGITAGAIMVGGSLLISALTQPEPAATEGTNDQIEQLNSISASGNTARLFEPHAVQYGRIKSFPDWATWRPWSEFEGNDQYLNVLLAVGLGKYEHEALYVDDTLLWTASGGVSPSFEGVSIAFYDPYAPVTLFPANVVQAEEVAGQEVTETPIGGFAASGPDTIVDALAFDVVFPGGLFRVNKETGEIEATSVTVIAEARQIDNAGNPLGGWFIAASQTFTMGTRNPQRASLKAAVGIPGRYEGRMSRTTPPSHGGFWSGDPDDNTTSNAVAWAGLRAFIRGPSSFPCTIAAIRIKATNQLSQASARKFGYLGTRKLRVWKVDSQTFVEEPTRNPFWAAWDAATDTVYGLDWPPSKVDFQALYDQALAADARGDRFDFRFTSGVPAREALDTILRVSRARYRCSGDVLSVVRDEWSDVPRMLLTDREIVRGSLNLEYILNTDDSADAVVVQYWDETKWGPGEVQYPPNSVSFTAQVPFPVRLPGVGTRAHAYREAGFYYLQSQMRRINVGLDTEHDGRMLGFGSRVRVQTELPESWGATGAVVARTGSTLTVEPAPAWTVGEPHYIAIRTKVGRQFGPVLCARGNSDANIVLNTADLAAVESALGLTLAAALERADGADDPSFDFGPGSSRARDCIVMTGRPSGDRVTLGLVVDNEAVHGTDLGAVPVTPSVPALRDPSAPVIEQLFARFRQAVAEPVLEATWWPAPGALYYIAQVSYDNGASWIQVYEGVANGFSAVTDRAALKVRVQGVGARQGAFRVADVAAPTIVIAPGAVNARSLEEGLKDLLTRYQREVTDTIRRTTERLAAIVAELDANTQLDKAVTGRNLLRTAGQITASYREEITVAVGPDSAIAQQLEELDAAIGNVEANLKARWVVGVTPDGAIAAYELQATAEQAYAGMRIVAFSDGAGGALSQIFMEADRFYIGKRGEASFSPVFIVDTSVNPARIILNADLIAPGSITASKINVATLSALTANMGTIIAGLMLSPSGLFRIDCTNGYLLINDGA